MKHMVCLGILKSLFFEHRYFKMYLVSVESKFPSIQVYLTLWNSYERRTTVKCKKIKLL